MFTLKLPTESFQRPSRAPNLCTRLHAPACHTPLHWERPGDEDKSLLASQESDTLRPRGASPQRPRIHARTRTHTHTHKGRRKEGRKEGMNE
eukprot:1667436-Amphidinium_carterae.1